MCPGLRRQPSSCLPWPNGRHAALWQGWRRPTAHGRGPAPRTGLRARRQAQRAACATLYRLVRAAQGGGVVWYVCVGGGVSRCRAIPFLHPPFRPPCHLPHHPTATSSGDLEMHRHGTMADAWPNNSVPLASTSLGSVCPSHSHTNNYSPLQAPLLSSFCESATCMRLECTGICHSLAASAPLLLLPPPLLPSIARRPSLRSR